MVESDVFVKKVLQVQSYIATLHEYLMSCDDNFDEFLENNMCRDACVAEINNLSESIKTLYAKYGAALTEYINPNDISGLIGMRDIIIHQYNIIDWRIIWIFLHDEMPRL